MKSSLTSSAIIRAILISILSLGIGKSTAAGENSNNPSVVKIGPTTRGDSLGFEQLKKITIMVMDSPPHPPKGIQRLSVASMSQSAVMLSVPTSTWTYGCSATSAGMIFGYYDRIGYSNMYTGPANGSVAPMTDLGQGIGTPIPGSCSIIATQNGFDGRMTRGHVDDYWTGYLNPGPDPWEGYWTEHTWGGCTADYMGTSQWKWDYDLNGTKENNLDGATNIFAWEDGQKLYDFVPSSSYGLPQTELCHGMRLFAESRGYTIQENYTQRIYPATSGGFSLADYRTEINNGHPVMIQLEGHSMVGVGYESAGSQTIYVHDTWDNIVHSMTWGGSYSGMQHWAVTVIHLNPVNPAPPVAQDGSANTQINTPVTITLVAADDSLPNPPGVLSYIITSLPANGSLSDPGAGSITAVPYTVAGNGNQVVYTPAAGYSGGDNFTFKANDGGAPPDGGDSSQANVSIDVSPVYSIYVDVNATGANNGSSWADAYTGLQSALSAAGGDNEIWVAVGTYKPTTDADRTISFVMKDYLAVYGGFAGTETSRNQRNWVANPTVLSGDIGTPGNNSDNSYHVVIGKNNATLDGFTIAGGNANGEDWPYMYNYGGGMFNESVSPTVTNCTFSANSANYGGGMSNYYDGSPTVTNCTFSGNSASTGEYPGCGGGMYNVSSIPTITNCTFSGNSAGNGGGMFNYYNSIPTITNCTFSGNSAGNGGGMNNGSVSNPTINNCILWGNTAPYGPQIYNFENSSPNITYSDVQGGQPGMGNINQVPRFIGAGDFRLKLGGPCIDAGNNSAVPAGVTTDLAGNPRFIDDPNTFDTGAGTPPVVDMGAFEYFQVLHSIVASAGPNGAISPSGIFNVIQGDNLLFTATPNTGYMVDKWYIDGNLAQTGGLIYTLNNIQTDAIVLVNFKPTIGLTMAVSPSEAGITVPAMGTNEFAKNEAIPISAQSNAGYSFVSWSAAPAENVVFGDTNNPYTTATLSDNATVTAIFNTKPVAVINTVNVLVITDANSATLDAAGSTDDGLPNPPGVMTYHWEKISGPNTCNILDPDLAVTGVLFWGLGFYEFSVTVSDGQLQDVKSATVDVVVDVAYVAGNGDDNIGLGTIENPFATIRKGINTVRDYGTVIALEGTYYENIYFGGKKVTVRSNNPDDANVVANTIIDANDSGGVVTFNSGEDANSVLAGFTITGGNSELGGGIYINEASPVIEKNLITRNSASGEGGGIYCQGGSATIRYNKISGNYSFLAGGVSFEGSFAVLQNNLIVVNTADYDSGVVCVEGQPKIANNTIAGNVAGYYDDSSGLVISSSLPAIIYNNIVAFNRGAPGIVSIAGLDPNYFTYNDVYGHTSGNYLSWYLPTPDQTGVNGNISVDPNFADIDADDYHLLPESLLIDAGDLSSDWSSEPRPNGGRINLGAYGNTSEASCSLAGDITWDKKVDFKDFAKLAFYWLQNEPSVDIAPLVNADNIVDVGDLAVLAEHWLEEI